MTLQRIAVLILVDKFDYHGSSINGPARYYSWLVAGLDKKQFDVTLCTLRGRGPSDEFFRREGIEVAYLNARKYDPFVLLNIARLIRNKKIDLLHLTGYGATTFGRVLGYIFRIPTIVHEHWVDPEFGWPLSVLEQALAITTTRAIAISNYAKIFLITKKKIREEKIVVIPNGIPLEQFYLAKQEQGLEKRREFGISMHAPVIGIVGMLHENKGHNVFLEAASIVNEEVPHARFVIIGDGELRSQLEKIVKDRMLQRSVLFLGQQSDMPAILQMLDIFVMSSFSETAPLSLLEAMAAGTAIITTDCGGPSEVIQDQCSGFVVPVGDAKAIAEKIRLLIENSNIREENSSRAKKESTKYDLKFTVHAIEQMYVDITRQK